MLTVNKLNSSWVKEYFSRIETRNFIPSGYQDLDRFIDGFYGGCLYIIGARPGVGKTTLILNLISNLKNKKSLVFTTEMSKERFAEKMLSLVADIDHRELRQNLPEIREKVYEKISLLSNCNLFINDDYKPRIDQVKILVEQIKPEIVFFDYFQNSQLWGEKNSYIEYTMLAEKFFNIGKEMNIPMVITSQLRRPTDESKPAIEDLKETGKLEESAHVVMLLSRTTTGLMLDVAKNRDGQIGTVELNAVWSINKLTNGLGISDIYANGTKV